MAEKSTIYSVFDGGIADFIRANTIPHAFAFSQSIDIRSDPYTITVLPRTMKESGSIVTGLPKWEQTYLTSSVSYIYDDAGNLYARTSAGSYSLLRAVGASHGNGLVYSGEDGYLWYALDKVIGRYGPLLSSTPTFVDDAFASFGGVPLNTASLSLVAASSQYASRADTASLSITGNIAIDLQIKPTSLPSVGNQMVLVSKWDESGTLRSYKFDINAVSGYFGDGSDGSPTISSNTTEAPIDSAATATAATNTISATNASFAAGQVVMIHQTRGGSAGTWERASIQSYSAGTITLTTSLMGTYSALSQVRVLKQYANVTINTGVTYSAKTWIQSVGGIIGFLANGTVTVTGIINAQGKGFDGTSGGGGGITGGGQQGEGTAGAGGTASSDPNGNGGGGGVTVNTGGGGGGNGSAGTNGSNSGGNPPGMGAPASGTADLTTMNLGGSGGSGNNGGGDLWYGGDGGGIVFIAATALIVTGAITANGDSPGPNGAGTGGGGGAGGSILLKCQTATLGTGLITATGGAGGNLTGIAGGTGGDGRIHLDYYTSYTGTTTPTLDASQDNSLVTNTTYQLRLSVSSTGLNSETLAYAVPIQTGTWQQVGVSWVAATATATFFLNADSLGTRTGTFTAIHDNASTFQIGMSKNGAGTAANFYDGLLDEGRLFNMTRSQSQMQTGLASQIPVNTAGLVAYYKLNGDYVDAVAGANTLTGTNTPVFVTDVPYPSPTTRLDIDQVPTPVPSGQTYAVPTTISETSTNRLTFTPGKDPQKSIQFNIGNIGTGTWVVTIHDSNNNVVATATVTTANMHTGNFEFIYTAVWSPLTNFTNSYHAHVTCASGSPTVVTGTSNDLTTADYVTYYQFLIEDDAWHPMTMFLNFWVIGNGRYLGKYEAPLYQPNLLNFGAGWQVRCLGYWNEYLAIGCTQGIRIDQTERGRIYFWNGYSSTFNFFIDVPEGGINALLGSRGNLEIIAGYKNQLLVYTGGASAQKLRDMPNIEAGKYSGVYPQAMTMYRGLLRYGVAGEGDSATLYKGVYTYGSTNLRYPDIFTYDYPISTGSTQGSGVQIGLVTVVNQKLLIGWRDGLACGVDYVADTNPPYSTAFIQFLLNDMGDVTQKHRSLEAVAVFKTLDLTDNQAVTLSYDLDTSGTFTANTDTNYLNSNTLSRLLIDAGDANEAQLQLTLTSGASAPVVKGVGFVQDPLQTEGRS